MRDLVKAQTLQLCIALLCLFAIASRAGAQDVAQSSADAKTDERSTGLPGPIKWTFNFDAGWGTFGFANSLYQNPKEGVKEDLSDQWFEGYIKPSLTAVYTLPSSSEIYSKMSAVGERTYGEVPPAFGEDVGSFGPEDLSIGWRSGKSIPLGDNVVDVVVGRAPYQLSHGMLLYDGAAEGGSRGGYWTNARKAFAFAAIGRFQPAHHKVEMFYLDRDELPEADSGSRLWGTNYELSLDDHNTIGATYMKWFANSAIKPARNGLNVFNVRAYTAPIHTTPDLSFEFEYASERNGEALDSNAWTLQSSYQLSKVTWKPKLTYRYAFFQGDDPHTPANEAFDPLMPGFSDWGSWWQGEIAGEYFIANSNLGSHLIRLHVTPSDTLSGGLMFYRFGLNHPESFGPDVTSSKVAFETDAYTDWKLNRNVTISVVGAYANPGNAVRQATGRTKDFLYGMVYVAYSF